MVGLRVSFDIIGTPTGGCEENEFSAAVPPMGSGDLALLLGGLGGGALALLIGWVVTKFRPTHVIHVRVQDTFALLTIGVGCGALLGTILGFFRVCVGGG